MKRLPSPESWVRDTKVEKLAYTWSRRALEPHEGCEQTGELHLNYARLQDIQNVGTMEVGQRTLPGHSRTGKKRSLGTEPVAVSRDRTKVNLESRD